jgi:hypothetical protein
MTVMVEPDLGGNDGQGSRLAFRTIHGVPLEAKTTKRAN